MRYSTEEAKPTKIYINKLKLDDVVIYPAPEDLENWIEAPYDKDFIYLGKIYDVLSGTFVENTARRRESQLSLRKEAYGVESDPLFLEWQYDLSVEAEEAWRTKVNDIKLRYPL